MKRDIEETKLKRKEEEKKEKEKKKERKDEERDEERKKIRTRKKLNILSRKKHIQQKIQRLP